jgi:alkylation response protein AidB-like acyl-CoA dehydrogenase
MEPQVHIRPEADRRVAVDLVQRAIRVADNCRERAGAADESRLLAPETVRDLQNSGLLLVSIPGSLGGHEADLVAQVQIGEILGAACASTAWCWINHLASLFRLRAWMGDQSLPYVNEVVDHGAFLAHVQIPSGETRPVADGFVASGKWPFASGSTYASWFFLSTMVPGIQDGDGASNGSEAAAQNRWLLVPQGQPGMRIEDTWRAMSLRASMSHDVVLEEVFVPRERAPLMVATAPEYMWIPEDPPALRVPYFAAIRLGIGAMMLGIARAALDDVRDYAARRPMSVGGQLRSRMPANQFAVADAAMLLEGGRAYIYRQAEALAGKAMAGEPFTREDIIQSQMACLVARQNSQQAVNLLFQVRGAHGLYESASFERYYRDVRMGTLHAVIGPDLERELIGKHLLGVPADVQPRWG